MAEPNPSLTDMLTAANQAPPLVEPTVTVPIDASGTATAAALRTIAFQVIGFVGMLIAVLGLGDNSWIVKIYKIAHSDQAIPLISLGAGAIASIWQIRRVLARHFEKQVASFLLPEGIMKSPSNPSAAVVKAAEQAITVMAADDPTALGGKP